MLVPAHQLAPRAKLHGSLLQIAGAFSGERLDSQILSSAAFI